MFQRAQWSELSCKTQPFETVVKKYSSRDVSTILLSDRNIFTMVTLQKPKELQTIYANAATRKKDVAKKLLRT